MTTLFDALKVGRLTLQNRVVMAPMTRARADDSGRPLPIAATYYAQRASAGLIISEGIFPEPMGKGYVHTPGLADAVHVEAWKAVTAAVHVAGGEIVAQLMHAGRISHPSLLPGNATPVAPSAVRAEGTVYTDSGMLPHPVPVALTEGGIAAVIQGYAAAARRAIEAGFDGVEFHAASGYLPMQFLSSGTNLRTDRYGGSATNRVRFTVEALQAIAAAIGADRLGIKISPEMAFNDITDHDPMQTCTTLVDQIAPLGLAYLHVAPAARQSEYHHELRKRFPGTYIAGAGFDAGSAAAIVASGGADAVAFGQLFIANPDLPQRLREGTPLAAADPSTFYAGGEKGYIDYPVATAA
jgi:N-ethylmaleimide reductase